MVPLIGRFAREAAAPTERSATRRRAELADAAAGGARGQSAARVMRRRAWVRRLRTPALLCCLVLITATATAQSAAAPGRHEVPSAFLPPTHWAVAAARRLAVLRLADRSFGWGDASLTADAVAAVLADAAANASEQAPEFVTLAEGFRARFAREFPETVARLAGEPAASTVIGDGTFEVGGEMREGVLLPGGTAGGPPNNKLGHATVFLADATVTSARGLWMAEPVPHLGLTLAPAYSDGSWRPSAAHALVRWGSAGLWGGRRAMSYEPGATSGIALSGAVPLTGVGGALIHPLSLPWIFRLLGPVRGESFLAQLDSNASIRHPYFSSTRISITPHSLLLVGLTHAAMFGGDGVAPLSLHNFWCMIGQGHAGHCTGSEYEVQMGTVDLRIHAPGPLPTTLYGEWGLADNKTAWKDIPAVIAGATIDAVPGLPALSLGFEHTLFHTPCTSCDYFATWYQHFLFRGGWAVDGTPLGHPLGGEGRESLLSATVDDPSDRRSFTARIFTRLRGPANLFAPTHQGPSNGGALHAEWALGRSVDAVIDAEHEVAPQWHQTRLSMALRTSR